MKEVVRSDPFPSPQPPEDLVSCGIGSCRPKWIQRFSSKKSFIGVYSLLALVQGMVWAYFSDTITTLQKRFKISSQTAGIVMAGNEISLLLVSVLLSYLGGRRHRPKWICFGVIFSALSFLLVASLHLFYGTGHNALSLTLESQDPEESSVPETLISSLAHNKKIQLCNPPGSIPAKEWNGCSAGETIDYIPLILIFISQFISGIGVLLFFSLGGTYLDDNLKKTKTPLMFGISMFARLLGPLVGYSLAALCLKVFVNPSLTPVIDNDDPRWIGAWWLGWIVLGILMGIVSILMFLFPRELPRAQVRRKVTEQMYGIKDDCSSQITTVISSSSRLSSFEDFYSNMPYGSHEKGIEEVTDSLPKIRDLPRTILGLVFRNKVYLFNNLAAIFYLFSAIGYMTYMPKYLETFMQSEVNASMFSGGVIFSQGAGLLLSGAIISRLLPSARKLAAWNVIVGLLSTIILISFTQLGCSNGNLSNSTSITTSLAQINSSEVCNGGCECSLTKIQPVCHQESNELFVSPCHAGCSSYNEDSKAFYNCSCGPEGPESILHMGNCSGGFCFKAFLIFLGVFALSKFIDSPGRIGNLLIQCRCVHPSDKSLAIGITISLLSLFAFLPSPIFYGFIIDSTCLVWDTKCNSKSLTSRANCLLYDGPKLRFYFNLTAAAFTFIGVFFDALVWYYVKDLDLYDENSNIESGFYTYLNGTGPQEKKEKEEK